MLMRIPGRWKQRGGERWSRVMPRGISRPATKSALERAPLLDADAAARVYWVLLGPRLACALFFGQAAPSQGRQNVLAEISSKPWSVVVIYDLPNGAMRHLPTYLS
jgi:hypothetical protein